MASQDNADGSSGSDMGVSTLIEQALDLEEIDINLFRSKSLWTPFGARGVFGGQVVGQALAAANRTVGADFQIHSLHSYFLLPGDSSVPILYQVDRTRDGRSFATRAVSAIQRGKAIFTCQASYQVPEDNVVSHQWPMPSAPAPESLRRHTSSGCPCTSDSERYQSYLEDPRYPAQVKEWLQLRLNEPVPVDIRMVEASTDLFTARKVDPARQQMWMRSNGSLGNDPKLHQCVVAYESDFRLLSTGLLPHGMPFNHPRIRIMASLDHSMWFHEPFRADEWLLYELESPKFNNGRSLTLGRIYTQDGRLVVSVAQEGLIRIAPPRRKDGNSAPGAPTEASKL